MDGYGQWYPGMVGPGGPVTNPVNTGGPGGWTYFAPQGQSFNNNNAGNNAGSSNQGTDHQWHWSNDHGDFISYGIQGEILGYKNFQMMGRDPNNPPPPQNQLVSQSGPQPGPQPGLQPGPEPGQGPGQGPNNPESIPRSPMGPPARRSRPLKPFEQPLDPRFTYVEKPKRFFSIGRIFKAAWFEPGGQDVAGRSDIEYSAACPGFYGEKPYAKFRWFVVVRKRLHHSLCFSITTFGGKGAVKASRGRPQDFVVLHAASVPAPAADPEEKIARDPIGVIIEDGEQFISPLARLDCGRVYSVEDNLKVMKVGRVHPDKLQTLEMYFKEGVR